MSRRVKYFAICFSSLFFLISSQTNAAPIKKYHVIVAPTCLVTQLKNNYQPLTKINTFSLIQVNDAGIDNLIAAKNNQKNLCGGFMDATKAWEENQPQSNANPKKFLSNYIKQIKPLTAQNTYEIKYPKTVDQLFNQLNPQHMWDTLTQISTLDDRYANGENGVAFAKWIKTDIEDLASKNKRDDVTAYFIETGKQYKQPSVVVKIGTSNDPGIVIGAHMDTLSSSWGKKPGADDDGSGTATVLEIANTLLSSGMHFKKPIYLVWYAAEEEGLVGSSYVVSEFKNKNILITAVLHFDMTGFAYQNDPTLWLMTDYVNKDLVAYLETLITTYVKEPVKYSQCGYACSDHATWTKNGFAAGIAAEAAYEHTNPVLHSSKDTIDKLSLSHMTDYLKLGTAFAVELAEPTE